MQLGFRRIPFADTSEASRNGSATFQAIRVFSLAGLQLRLRMRGKGPSRRVNAQCLRPTAKTDPRKSRLHLAVMGMPLKRPSPEKGGE